MDKREELARLLCRLDCRGATEKHCSAESCEFWTDELPRVDEFLDALMEPSEAMIESGARNIWNENEACHGGDPEWDNMGPNDHAMQQIYRNFAGDAYQAILTHIKEGR